MQVILLLTWLTGLTMLTNTWHIFLVQPNALEPNTKINALGPNTQ